MSSFIKRKEDDMKKQTKYYVMSIQMTNDFVANVKPDEKVIIISLGNSLVKLPEMRNNIINIDIMMDDILSIPMKEFVDPFKRLKFWLIDSLIQAHNADHFIIRCDAGASRSQAIATSLSRQYGIKFENNFFVGNSSILKDFCDYLGVSVSQEEYEKLFAAQEVARKERNPELYEKLEAAFSRGKDETNK